MAMETQDEGVTAALDSFEAAIGAIEQQLQPLLAAPQAELRAKLDPLESAKLDLTTAYAMNSLFWMYLTTQGVSPANHPVKAELDRIKTYMGKVRSATGQKEEPASKINTEAAKRFIKAALAGNDTAGDDDSMAVDEPEKDKGKGPSGKSPSASRSGSGKKKKKLRDGSRKRKSNGSKKGKN